MSERELPKHLQEMREHAIRYRHKVKRWKEMRRTVKLVQAMLATEDFSVTNVQSLAERLVRICKRLRAEQTVNPYLGMPLSQLKDLFIVEPVKRGEAKGGV